MLLWRKVVHVPQFSGSGEVDVITRVANRGLLSSFSRTEEGDADDVKLCISSDKVEVLVSPGQRVRES